MKYNDSHIRATFFSIVSAVFIVGVAAISECKAQQAPAKIREKDQATGTPDYVVSQQTNQAQKAIATPKKKKNKKKIRAAKSKQQNKGTQIGEPLPPSPNDALTGGITTSKPKSNKKEVRKERAAVMQKDQGEDLMEKKYNVKKPRPEAKKGGNVKAGIPVSGQAGKSAEQNQPTGAPDYVVNQQSNEPQRSISTPKKTKNTKKAYARKSKEANVGSQIGEAMPPSPNDEVSYGITSPRPVSNIKEVRKERAAVIQKDQGEEILQHQYNSKAPRDEAKRGKVATNGVPVSQRKEKSAAATGFSGNVESRSEGNADVSGSSITQGQIDKSTKESRKTKSKAQSTSSGDLPEKERIGGSEYTRSVVGEQNITDTKENRKARSKAQSTSSGDLPEKERIGGSEYTRSVVGEQNITDTKENRKARSKAQSTNSGDLPEKERIGGSEYTRSIVGEQDITDTKQRRKARSLEQSTNSGDLPEKERIGGSEYTRSIVGEQDITDTKQRRKARSLEQSTNTGDLPEKERIGASEFTQAIVLGREITDTKEKRKARSLEQSQNTGDIDIEIAKSKKRVEDRNGEIAGSYSGDIDARVLSEVRNYRKAANKEISSNVGDIEGVYLKNKKTEKDKAIQVREYRGTYNYNILADRKAHEKELDREMGSNQGDFEGTYQKMKETEKDKAVEVREYRGTYNYDILKDRKELRKEKQREIAANTGDIIGSYTDLRNRWKEQNKKVENYKGKIDYDLLKKQKDKMIALDREIHSYTGDILSTSLEKKKSTLRDKSRKATWYEGDLIVTKRSRSNHPSAVYLEAKDSKSIAAKEKLRKQLLKKSKKHREKEDPNYMRKEAPRPRYDIREYEIWETKTREGDGFPKDSK